MSKKFSCPSCGAPIRIKNRFVKLVTCDFCEHVSLVKESGLDPTGQTAKLTDVSSGLYLDAIGTLEGRSFKAVGRLRYQYEAGLWDEWFLEFENDRPGWLVEDEGQFILYHKETLPYEMPPFDQIDVGDVLTIDEWDIFVTEKRPANIIGGEGQLGFTLMPGETVYYVDGTADEQQISLEYTTNEVEFLRGQAIDKETLVIEENFW